MPFLLRRRPAGACDLPLPPYPKAVIFDWDDTLVESLGCIEAAINETREAFGLQRWSRDEVRVNCRRALKETFPVWFGARWEEARDFYYARYYPLREATPMEEKRGASELLGWLNRHAVPLAVVSNKRHDLLCREIERVGWQDLISAVSGTLDAPKPKPAREHVDHALGKAGLMASEDVWFVGDGDTDVLCARAAGCTPVFVGDPQEAHRLGVTHLFAGCSDVLDLLVRMHENAR